MKIKINYSTISFYIISAIALIFLAIDFNSAFSSLIMLIVFSLSSYLGSFYLQKENKDITPKIMKTTFVILFCVYILFLFSLLFSNLYYRRDEILETRLNLVPFKTITLFLDSATNNTLPVTSIITNLLGNIVAFMPFGFYLPILFKCFKKPYWFLIAITTIIIFVEVMQLVLMCGSCDIDDLILNVLGAFIFYLIVNNKIVTPFIKKIVMF